MSIPHHPGPVGRLLAVAFGCALAAAVGCGSTRHPTPAPPPHYVRPATDAAAPPGTYPDVAPDTVRALTDKFGTASAVNPAQRPLNILALSGGGQYGTYAAGLLVGWTESGTRPTFDVCTGISSGALTAAFAFLGPKYDPALRRLGTCLHGDDVFKMQPVRQLIRNSAVASSAPLARLVATEFNEEFVADLRAAHAEGRRLFVGTMNLQTKRLVVWDLTALAACGRPDAGNLVRRVLLATSSIAGFVPAVDIPVTVDGVTHVEPHVDAGGVSQVFVRLGEHHPRYGSAGPGGSWLAGSNLYLISGGKLYADPNMERQGALARATGNVSATLYALYRANLAELYSLCAASGMRFHLTSISPDVDIRAGSVAFDQGLMRRLFALGYDSGRGGVPWRPVPPAAESGCEEKPRAGVVFQTR